MIYKVFDITRDVKVAIDQNMTSEELLILEDIETLTLEEIIRSKIEEAARRIGNIASSSKLEEGHIFGDTIYWGTQESGWILLPDDFMRLITFRMSDWERSVNRVITPDNAEYQKQSSRYKGIRGNIQKPVCALVNRPEGKVLEFYSCKSEDAYVKEALYLPYPRIDEYDGIDISERCYRGVIYMIAALVMTTYGEGDKVSMFTELAKSEVTNPSE